MNTPLVGYLVMLANLQGNGLLKDMAIRVGDVGTIANAIQVDHPEFPLEAFKATGFFRIADRAIFLSNSVVNFIVDSDGNPGDQGIMITLYYDKVPETLTSTGLDDGTLEKVDPDKIDETLKKYYDRFQSVRS